MAAHLWRRRSSASDQSSCDGGTIKENTMGTRSVRLMLLGIGVLLFALTLTRLVFPFIDRYAHLDVQVYQDITFGVPVFGLALLLVGFCLKSRPQPSPGPSASPGNSASKQAE
jgi:hypothetical protein